MHKDLLPLQFQDNEIERKAMISNLPAISEIFKVDKKRTRSANNFSNGRKIRKSLSLLHIKVNVSVEERLTDINSNLFAIPFLGEMIGYFGNVDVNV